jgi:hypothetical protein
MTVPHADDAAGRPPHRPHQHDQPRVQPTGRDIPDLAVVDAVVDTRQVQPGENLPGPEQIEPPLAEDLLAPGKIARKQNLM